MIRDLLELLTYCRPAGTATERKFCREFIGKVPGAYVDEAGNWHAQIGPVDTPVLWSCHTDTVHRKQGRQNIVRTGSRKQYVGLPSKSKSSCLGGDDTVGVYLCLQMIAAGVPGRYLFHYGEEQGGQGSSRLARTHARWLSQFKYAIALDRAGDGDVITHQHGMRTASDAFAFDLARLLFRADHGLEYWPTDRGVYTDTAEYADLIPECTNLSVGYEGQHSTHEMIDLEHVERLREALLIVGPQIAAGQVPPTRDPRVHEPRQWKVYSGSGTAKAGTRTSSHGAVIATATDYRLPAYRHLELGDRGFENIDGLEIEEDDPRELSDLEIVAGNRRDLDALREALDAVEELREEREGKKRLGVKSAVADMLEEEERHWWAGRGVYD